MKGEIRFYHGEKIGQWIPVEVEDSAARDTLLQKLCADPEVEGFEATWEADSRT